MNANPNSTDARTDDVTADDALDAVTSAKGVRSPVLSNNTTTKTAEDGRVFVQFSTSHGYGRSNGVEALRELDDSFDLTYNPHGATQYAAQVADGMTRENAEAFVREGAEYVSVRGYHVRIEGFSSATESVEAEYPSSRFGDSGTEPRRDDLVDQLVAGTATPLNADDLLDDGDDLGEPSTYGEDEFDDDEDRRPCNRCDAEAVHLTTREVNGWINDASAYEVHKYECPACGATGSVHAETGEASGCVAPPAPPEPDDPRSLL